MTEARTISISIGRHVEDVYGYLANPAHLPEWSDFITAAHAEGDHWVVRTPGGESRITFAPGNAFGVLDHDVVVNSKLTVHVPMRVVKNGLGSEVLFTVFRQPGMNQRDYEADIGVVLGDLLKLKSVLERKQDAP